MKLNECVSPECNIRYYSGFCETGFFEGYNPANHIFDKTKVIRTEGHEATWFYLEKESDAMKKAAHNAILITNWNPTFVPWWPQEKIDNPGFPIVFSGIVPFENLQNNGFYSSIKPVGVDRLYKIANISIESPKEFLMPGGNWFTKNLFHLESENISFEDISDRLNN